MATNICPMFWRALSNLIKRKKANIFYTNKQTTMDTARKTYASENRQRYSAAGGGGYTGFLNSLHFFKALGTVDLNLGAVASAVGIPSGCSIHLIN